MLSTEAIYQKDCYMLQLSDLLCTLIGDNRRPAYNSPPLKPKEKGHKLWTQ